MEIKVIHKSLYSKLIGLEQDSGRNLKILTPIVVHLKGAIGRVQNMGS